MGSSAIQRRNFLKTAVATSTLAATGLVAHAEGKGPQVVAAGSGVKDALKADVLVVGAGSGGWPAALSAARAGSKVILVEDDMVPGGQPVDMYVAVPNGGPIVGIYREMLARLRDKHDFSVRSQGRGPWSKPLTWFLPSSYLSVILEMLGEQRDNLQLLCGARAVEVLVQDGNRPRVRGIKIERLDGSRQAIEAGVTIDASGTGILASLAGFATMYGRDARGTFAEPFGPLKADNKVQSCTWMFISQKVHPGPAMDFSKIHHGPFESGYGWIAKKNTERAASVKKGIDLESFQRRDAGTYIHWGAAVPCEDTRDPVCIAKAQREAFRRIEPDLHLLMENGYGVHLAPKLGVRESRRVLGEKVVTVNDLKSGKMPDDVVAQSTYWLDAWGEETLPKDQRELPPSGIPYGALVPRDSEGMLVACKSISGTHLAHSSYRCQPILASVGTAAGMAAALAAQNQTGVRDIPLAELQRKLKAIGVLSF